MTDVSTIIEWYRPNPFAGLAWISFQSSVLMLGGAIVMAFGRDVSGRVISEIQPYCIVIGILFVMRQICLQTLNVMLHIIPNTLKEYIKLLSV